MPLRFASVCDECGLALPARTTALWSRSLKKVRCLKHQTAATEAVILEEEPPSVGEPEFDRGTPGASVQAEFERRAKSREKRIQQKHPKIGKYILLLSDEPQSTRAWQTGAKGETGVGESLEELSVKYEFVILHDRQIPGSRANIDHIAVTRSGVYVIDAKNYEGMVRVVDPSGIFSNKPRELHIGSRNCTKLVTGMKKQVSLVNDALAKTETLATATGVLAFFQANWPLLWAPTEIDGILVNGKGIETILAKPGASTNDDIDSTARFLAQAFPSYTSSPRKS
jgi:hypothetical protein